MVNKKEQQKIIIYTAPNGDVDLKVQVQDETVWLRQSQIADIFGIDRTVVSRHIKNIFKDSELDEKVVCANFTHTTEHGAIKGKTQTKDVKYYNLDIILAVGYRTNSAQAIAFRKWSTDILRKYLTKGYTINPHMITKNYETFLSAVEDVKKLASGNKAIQSGDVIELVKAFAGTWFSLESYDEDKLPQKGFTKKDVTVQAKDLYKDVLVLKAELMASKNATELFAQEKTKDALGGILGNVLQSAFGREMYESVEEKAAHLLYFVVKNHAFVDGNKRTGAFCFVWFLSKAGIKYNDKITPEALTAITLLVAESDPKDKDRIIGLLLLMLKG